MRLLFFFGNFLTVGRSYPYLPRQDRHTDEHVFDKDAVACGGVVDEHVGDRAHKLAVLDYWATRQACGQ